MLGGVDVHHRAASGHDRHPVGHQLTADDEHAGGAGAADELVRGDEDGVLDRGAGAVHLDVDVGGAGGEVPEAQGAVLVEQVGHALGVGDDAGDVGGGGERADPERPVGVARELLGQVVQGDPAVAVLVDGDDVGDGLAPRDLVGVVLEGADEHDRALVGGDRRHQVVASSSPAGMRSPRMPMILSIAAVLPEPQKTTTVSSSPPTPSRMIRRASSRRRVVWSPVPLASVWVLA